MRRPTVLVLRALGLGDFLTGLPALALLRRAQPDHHIVLAAPRHFAGLACLTDMVDRLLPAHELDPISDPPHRPELAIDLHGNGPESRRLLLASAPHRLIAFGSGGARWQPNEYEAARWCRLVAEDLPAPGIDYPGVVGALPVPPGVSVPSSRTVVHVGAKSRARRWPAGRFVEVAERLRSAGHRVLVTGHGGEAAEAKAVAAQAGVDSATELTLEELCALVSVARLVISGDTGVAHVAYNYSTPSVVLFGPVSPAVWGPPPNGPHVVLWHGDGTGDPHGRTTDPALMRIEVGEVLEAVEQSESTASRSPLSRVGG
jgi:ADP-heptose:LPS heptosyltransferase